MTSPNNCGLRYLRIALLLLMLGVHAGLSACQKSPDERNGSAVIDTEALDAVLTDFVESGSVVGASALVYIGDNEVYYGNFGFADREAGTPWARDTLVNIYSMTKPVTGVTLMSLHENGAFELDDPLSKFLPEFEDAKVAVGVSEDGRARLVSPNRPIEIIDIMRHTAGFGYGWDDTYPDRAMRQADVLNPSKPLEQFSTQLAALPLHFHPGEQWKYGVSVDVQARLAEAISGQSFESLLTERVLAPLGMAETGYFVPADKKSRLSAVYIRQDDGSLMREPDELVYGFWSEKPVQTNGGHGLVATIDDFMQFARMLQNEGELDGARVLQPETIRLMATDHLPASVTHRDFLPSKGQVGFGLDFAVRTEPPVSEDENYGVPGEFFWDGRASTLFWVDPENDLTAVFFTQVVPFDDDLHRRFRRAVYEALNLI